MFILFVNRSCAQKETGNENENKLGRMMMMMTSDEGDPGRVVLRVLRYDVDGVQGL